MTSGIEAIAAERNRQIEKEGYDAEHDSEHTVFDLVSAAYCYANAARRTSLKYSIRTTPIAWPWEDDSWKPSDDTLRNLEKAGALIAAAIDRLDAAE